MGLFSFLKSLKSGKVVTLKLDPNDFVPDFWEDDYCQIEIVPLENKAFIQKQTQQIEELATKSKVDYGFSETFERGPMPLRTISKEIRVDYFESTLLGFQFPKAKHIRYEGNTILDCENGKTKAFGFSNFTIYFDTGDQFVENIWIHTGLISSVTQFDIIKSVLYALGEECELILVDWNKLEFFVLADMTQVQKYLCNYRK